MNNRDIEIKELRANGYTLLELANIYNITYQRINQIVGKKGLKQSWSGKISRDSNYFGIRHINAAIFWENVTLARIDECWEWNKSKFPTGYGHGNKKLYGEIYSHRIAFKLSKGTIPAGLDICHTCDNPSCCNPNHLYAGTVKDNMLDRSKRGRVRKTFTKEQIIEIRNSNKSQKMLADIYHTHGSYISIIKSRKIWKWLD